MKSVYLLTHEASNNNWTEVYKSKRGAKKAVARIVKEYKDEGIDLKDLHGDGTWFENDNHEIYINFGRTLLNP